jgi:hypothetical protein
VLAVNEANYECLRVQQAERSRQVSQHERIRKMTRVLRQMTSQGTDACYEEVPQAQPGGERVPLSIGKGFPQKQNRKRRVLTSKQVSPHSRVDAAAQPANEVVSS